MSKFKQAFIQGYQEGWSAFWSPFVALYRAISMTWRAHVGTHQGRNHA